MTESTVFDEIEAQLGDGWMVALISTITPGIVRLQLCGREEMYEGRACIEGETLEQAVRNAVLFTQSTPVDEWESKFWNQMEFAGDEPFCACPKCDKSLSFEDEDGYTQTKAGLFQFTCSRCGTISVWELQRAFPILISKQGATA